MKRLPVLLSLVALPALAEGPLYSIHAVADGITVRNHSPSGVQFKLRITGENAMVVLGPMKCPTPVCDMEVSKTPGDDSAKINVVPIHAGVPMKFDVQVMSATPVDLTAAANAHAAVKTTSNAPSPAYRDVNKCRGADGRTIYSDARCPPSTAQVTSKKVEMREPAKAEAIAKQTHVTTLVLKRSGNGMFRTEGHINGNPMQFLVDTGATYVSVPEALAFRSGLACRERGMSNTANGKAPVCYETANELKIGPFLLRNIRVSIHPNMTDTLIGMNALNSFRVESENGEMRISLKEPGGSRQ